MSLKLFFLVLLSLFGFLLITNKTTVGSDSELPPAQSTAASSEPGLRLESKTMAMGAVSVEATPSQSGASTTIDLAFNTHSVDLN